MNLLRRCLGRAKTSIQHSHELDDKNEQQKSDKESDKACTREPVNDFMMKMLNLISELVIFCLVFMAYAAITNDPPKVTKAPAAYPFFPRDSIVKDFYRGEIMRAVEQAKITDLSFIFFYAPWDAQSQAAKKEFLIAAEHMKDNVKFTAVNCWHPGSECRMQYGKVYRWPVLIVYPSHGSGIQYHGPLKATHMISFLKKILKPVKIINETDLQFDEAFIVAELNVLPGSKEFVVYYTTALKYLEADYLGRVTFYVKPVKNTQNKFSLYCWNQVRVLDLEPSDWKPSKILNWMIKNIHLPSSWVAIQGSKSVQLSEHLQPGPSLILFTPQNQLHRYTDQYMMMQEIAQEYKNCENWGLTFDMMEKRMRNWKSYENLKKTCPIAHIPKRKISSITTGAPFLNTSKIEKSLGIEELSYNILGLNKLLTNMCQDLEIGECYDILPQLERPEVPPQGYRTSMPIQDPKSMENLKKRQQKDKCDTFLLAEKTFPAVFIKSDFGDHDKPSVENLGCVNSNSNQSLSFVALDSLMYGIFGEILGVDLAKRHDRSAVIIVNEKLESHYIMQKPITSRNLRQFIRQYHNGTLKRSLNSKNDVHSPYNPSYQVKVKSDENEHMVLLQELNGNNFLGSVMENNKIVLVFYYSKQCSYCNGFSYNLLTLARKLSFVDNIKFARINGDDNILPWQYTMPEYPTILFFPAVHKEETRVFPSEIPITVPNLLGFILANVDASTRLHVIYSVCLNTQIEKDKIQCLATIRNETITLINSTLQKWRQSNWRQKQLHLHNLQQLRQLQFLLTHTPYEFSLIDKYVKNIQSSGNFTWIKDEL